MNQHLFRSGSGKKVSLLLPMVLGMAVTLTLWLGAGIVQDPEFDEYHFQWKAHPTFKLYFYSPTGMSDNDVEDLPAAKQQDERDYRYYVLGE